MLPHRAVCANLDGIAMAAAARPRRRRPRLVAAAVPRHGPHRAADHPDDHRRRPRARRAAGLPGQPGPLDGVDVRPTAARSPPAPTSPTRWRPGRSRRAEGLDLSRLRIALNGAEPVDPDTVGDVRRRRRALRPRPGCGVPGVRHGRGGIAGTFPDPVPGLAHRRRRPPRRSRPSATPRRSTGDAERPRACAMLGRPVPGLEIRIVDPATGDVLRRARGRRAADPGHLASRPATTAAPRPPRELFRRRLAAHRRPRLPRSTASSWCAAASRT